MSRAPMITAAQLQAVLSCPRALADLYQAPLEVALDRYDITTPDRIAAFVAQVGHESARLHRVTENLNYSAFALARTWPSRYRTPEGEPNARAMALAGKPEAIANATYCNRMGNGTEASGDGWRFRGRGLIQITGRHNYVACGKALGLDLITQPETIEEPIYAALSAGWFWHTRQLNILADRGDIEAITRLINGGLNGIADRVALYNAARRVLA